MAESTSPSTRIAAPATHSWIVFRDELIKSWPTSSHSLGVPG
ncbi:hypothetical protein [Nocardia niigatensis]|nr:hypothetical protein [Nocardia niigatensis]